MAKIAKIALSAQATVGVSALRAVAAAIAFAKGNGVAVDLTLDVDSISNPGAVRIDPDSEPDMIRYILRERERRQGD